MNQIQPNVTGRKPSAATAIEPEELISEDEAAGLLRQKPTTLTAWRHEKRGPAWIKVGRGCFYRRADINAWLGEQRHVPGAA